MKQHHRDNLAATIDHVENNVSDEQIGMEDYKSVCGTLACIVGHSINADIWKDSPFVLANFISKCESPR